MSSGNASEFKDFINKGILYVINHYQIYFTISYICYQICVYCYIKIHIDIEFPKALLVKNIIINLFKWENVSIQNQVINKSAYVD